MSVIKIFEDKNIRAKWNEDEDCWFFVVQDVIRFLTDSDQPSKYWTALKARTYENEGIQLSTFCRQLKFKAKDGKTYKYESASNEALFRIIQSVPSPKAEPFKRWLAQLGKERIEEIENPKKAIDRASFYYEMKGREKDWIDIRMNGIATRNGLTKYWQNSGVKNTEYAILTNQIYESTFGVTAANYKIVKGLKKANSLRDNMTPMELVVTMFAEQTAKEIAEATHAEDLEGNKKAIQDSGDIVHAAIKDIQEKTGKKIVSKENFKHTDTTEKTRVIVQSEIKQLREKKNEFDTQLNGLLSVPKPPKGVDKK